MLPLEGKPGLPIKGAKKTWLGRRDGIRLDLRVPPQAVADGQVGADLPLVLKEERRLQLRNGLRAGVFGALAVDTRELQEQHQRTDDGYALGQVPMLLVEPSEHSTNFGPMFT